MKRISHENPISPAWEKIHSVSDADLCPNEHSNSEARPEEGVPEVEEAVQDTAGVADEVLDRVGCA